MNGTAFELGTFGKRGDPPFVGIVLGNDEVIELAAAHAAYRASPHRGTLSETGSIFALLENWDANFAVLQEIVAFFEKERPHVRALKLSDLQALPIVGDIRDGDSVAGAVAKTVEQFGGIDICVNNASAINLGSITEVPLKRDRKSTRLNSSHRSLSRMPSSA